MPQSLFFCTQSVNKSNIKRETRHGVEHIIINSLTLPPDIVMNGMLFATSEITDEVIEMFNKTPATIEHPEVGGVFVSANDPEIDLEGFRIGAFNENAHRTEDGRVSLDKVINVQKALQSEKGKRLLDRIHDLETNDKAKPIHTSIGVFTNTEVFDKPQMSANGQKFTRKAVGIVPDHDAILIDSVGAATPKMGTGIGVNKEKIDVEHFIVEEDASDDKNLKANNEDDPMRKNLIARLEKLGLEVNAKATDDELIDQLNAALSVNKDDENDKDKDKNTGLTVAEVEAIVKPLTDQVAGLTKQLSDNADTDFADKSKVILACAKFKELDEEILKSIFSTNSDKFNAMHAESIPARNIGSTSLEEFAEDKEFEGVDLNKVEAEDDA